MLINERYSREPCSEISQPVSGAINYAKLKNKKAIVAVIEAVLRENTRSLKSNIIVITNNNNNTRLLYYTVLRIAGISILFSCSRIMKNYVQSKDRRTALLFPALREVLALF